MLSRGYHRRIVLVGILVLIGVAAFFHRPPASDKELRYWLEALDNIGTRRAVFGLHPVPRVGVPGSAVNNASATNSFAFWQVKEPLFFYEIEAKLIGFGSEAAPEVARRLAFDDTLYKRFHNVVSKTFRPSLVNRLPTPRQLKTNRTIAKEILDRLGPNAKTAVPVLVDIVRHREPEPAWTAIDILMKFKEEARVAIPGMIDCVRNGTEDLPERAARALAEMEAKESIPVIVAAMKGRRIQIMSAVLVLHRLGYEAKEAVPQLCQELKGRNRIGAAQCLSLISSAHSKVAIPDLTGMLGSKESRERSAAVAALASMGPDAAPAIPKLIQAAGDEWYFVRDAAIQALGKIGPAAKEALPVLAKALNDPNPNVAESARASISQIDPKALPEGAAK